MSDIDLLGHVNNAAYWHAVEERLLARGLDLRGPIMARLDHRQAIDLGDDVWLAEVLDNTKLGIAFNVGHVGSAVAEAEIAW